MIEETLLELLASEFRHPFTPSQRHAAQELVRYLLTPARNAAFILRGYAGTGKTSLVAALVRTLRRLERNVVLLAPTGRAAKVFAAYAGVPAYTIHKQIYRQQTFRGEDTRFSLGYNKAGGTLFIVDEASMVTLAGGGSSLFGTGRLLEDLISYVYAAPGCRLLLVGDVAQLPPVGEAESPALRRDVLEAFGLLVGEADLTEVVRQTQTSDVLAAATLLREQLADGFNGLPSIATRPDGEVRYCPGDEFFEELISAYDACGTDETLVITRSNKRANLLNAAIRARVFDSEEELGRGDHVMVVKNNYFWPAHEQAALPKGERLPFDFLANGDTAEVLRVRNHHEQYGFHFADVELRFPDYDGVELTCRALLDTLRSEAPALTHEESLRLYEGVMQDYAHLPSKAERLKGLREDPYYNAVQLKYAYAVTCHKAQGGQWKRVFVDQGFVAPDMLGAPYLRWLYTAFTRTRGLLYLLNWPEAQRAEP